MGGGGGATSYRCPVKSMAIIANATVVLRGESVKKVIGFV